MKFRAVLICPLFALLLVCVCSWTICAHAQPAAPVKIVGIRGGFAGHFKVGAWAPFEVLLEGGGEAAVGRVELTVTDCDGVPSRVHSSPHKPIVLEPGEKASVAMFAKIGQLTSDVVVGFHAENGWVGTRRFNTADAELAGILPSAAQLIVALGAPLSDADRTYFQQRDIRVADVENVAQLPTEWYGFEGVDAVVLATGNDQSSAQWSSDSAQLAALDEWVRMGGTLVVSVGPGAAKILASGSPLAKLVPGTLETMVPLPPSTALESYAETTEPIVDGRGRLVVQVPKLIDVRGKIEAYAGRGPRDLPLVVRAPHGFGQVVFVAVDLAQKELVEWPGRKQFLENLFGRAVRGSVPTETDTLGQVTTLGFVDLTGQLRGALDQFADVQLVPFWLVAVLVVLYIACIGPADYFLVKRVLGRVEATWVTFSITVVVFSVGAYLLAYQLKGRELRANRLDLVDFDAESNLVRGTSWASVFTPESETYDLSIDPRPAIANSTSGPRTIFSWMGLPGDGFGGMNPKTGSLPLFTVPYDFSGELDRLTLLPIAVWSTRSFVGRWWANAPAPIDAELADDGSLKGTLTSRLDAPLEDSVLIYDNWAYPLRTLEPRERIDIAGELDPQTVETFLRRVTVRGDRDVAPPYDPASFDIPRIVEIMGCHELAGGETYTGLANESQEFVDLSRLVGSGRAILVGRQATTAAGLLCDGRPLDDPAGQKWTFYRFVFPVKSQPRP